MDKGTFYRLAASYLGESEVKQGTAVARSFDDLSQHVVALALDYTDWQFAHHITTLKADSAGNFLLPIDCLEIRVCSLASWRVVGRLIVPTTKTDTCEIEYKSSIIADTLALPEFEPLFCEGCALLLASKAAPRVTSNFTLAGNLEQAANEKLYRAKLKIARSQASNDQTPNNNKQ